MHDSGLVGPLQACHASPHDLCPGKILFTKVLVLGFVNFLIYTLSYGLAKEFVVVSWEFILQHITIKLYISTSGLPLLNAPFELPNGLEGISGKANDTKIFIRIGIIKII